MPGRLPPAPCWRACRICDRGPVGNGRAASTADGEWMEFHGALAVRAPASGVGVCLWCSLMVLEWAGVREHGECEERGSVGCWRRLSHRALRGGPGIGESRFGPLGRGHRGCVDALRPCLDTIRILPSRLFGDLRASRPLPVLSSVFSGWGSLLRLPYSASRRLIRSAKSLLVRPGRFPAGQVPADRPVQRGERRHRGSAGSSAARRISSAWTPEAFPPHSASRRRTSVVIVK